MRRRGRKLRSWYGISTMSKQAQASSTLPMSFGGQSHDGESMIADKEEVSGNGSVLLASARVFRSRRSGSVCNMLALG